jgi:hypothetical protein
VEEAQKEVQCFTEDGGMDYDDPNSEKDTKRRDMMRLYRKTRKLAYEVRGPWKPREKPKKEAKRVHKAYITLEDQVGVHTLEHRVGRREEFQTNLTRPHEFRKALIRVFRLKNLKWSLLHVDKEGNRARMPELTQIIEDEAEYVLVIKDQRRKRPSAPGTSKRRHFERANQKRRRGDFEWHPPQEKSSHKSNPPSHEERRSRGGHQEEGDSKRFTWSTPDMEPQVEPPRPPAWKPLVLVPQLVQLSEEAERKLADERMKEWSKDQEEYTERQFQEVQKKQQEQKMPRAKGAVDPGPETPDPREEEKRKRVEDLSRKHQEKNEKRWARELEEEERKKAHSKWLRDRDRE